MKKKDIPKKAKYYILPTPGQDITNAFYFYLELLDNHKESISCNKYRFHTWAEAGDYCQELRNIFENVGLIETFSNYDTSAPRGHQCPYIG